MNFRIYIALYIASLMPVVSVVPVYAGMSVYAGLSLSGCGPAEIRSSLYDKSGVVLLRRFSLIWVWFCYIFGMIYSLLSLPGSVFWSDVFANRCRVMPVCRLMPVVPVVPVCVGWCRECRLMSVWCRYVPVSCQLVPVVPVGAGGAGSCQFRAGWCRMMPVGAGGAVWCRYFGIFVNKSGCCFVVIFSTGPKVLGFHYINWSWFFRCSIDCWFWCHHRVCDVSDIT